MYEASARQVWFRCGDAGEECSGESCGRVSDDFDEDDYGQGELEDLEDDILDEASASVGEDELETEIGTLRELEAKANAVRMSGQDRKWDELSRLLQDNRNMFDKDGRREKLIIFTEHKDTLNYLASRIRMLLGTDESVITIQGGMGREERHRAEERFRQDADVRVMVATDAAGEGINLQRAHLMINYDLPWNPNRLEQRFGRIHRIGQTEVCHLWNLVAAETREGEVFQRLFSKLENEREALGGRVFDILGRLTFDDGSLSDLLMQAIRYGDNPEVKARLDTAVDNSVAAEALRKLLDERALTTDVMDINGVMRIREDMERMEAHKLEPHFIEAFFMTAMKTFGGRVSRREQGRFEVLEVPSVIRYAAVGSGRVLGSYERICFDKKNMTGRGLAPAELICPGHPLLDALVVMLIDRKGSLLKEGAVFVDDMDTGDKPRLLLYVEDSIQDGVERDDGSRRVVSKEFRFIELDAERNMRNAGYAPYLDYRAPRPSERNRCKRSWLSRSGSEPILRLKPEALPRTISFPTISEKYLRNGWNRSTRSRRPCARGLAMRSNTGIRRRGSSMTPKRREKPAIDSIPPKLRNVPTSFRPDSKHALPI